MYSVNIQYNIKQEFKTNKSMSRDYKNSAKCNSNYSNQGFNNVTSVLVSDLQKPTNYMNYSYLMQTTTNSVNKD